MPRLCAPHLNLVDRRGDPQQELIHGVLLHAESVGSLAELDRVLAGLARSSASGAASLDLIAHAVLAADCLLQIGDTLIDAEDVAVVALFTSHAVTIRTHARQLRLLGCSTAAHPRGRATLAALAAIVGIPVLGAIEPICDAYFAGAGFCDRYVDRLADASWSPPW